MSKEIYPNELYELLDELNNKEHYIEDYGYKYKRISLDDTQMLMLYIKHLENKNKETAEISNKFDKIFGMNITQEESFEFTIEESKQILDYITNLQQVIERLKEWKEDLLKENIELENIRKEAIEYINNTIEDKPLTDFDCGSNNACNDLLNILQNGDDNE